jgi:hypothetical protein
MLERGLLPDFPAEALAAIDAILEPSTRAKESTRDLRDLLWSSIDNDVQLVIADVERGYIDFKRAV